MLFRYKGKECKAVKATVSGSVAGICGKEYYMPGDWIIQFTDGMMKVVDEADWKRDSVAVKAGQELSVEG